MIVVLIIRQRHLKDIVKPSDIKSTNPTMSNNTIKSTDTTDETNKPLPAKFISSNNDGSSRNSGGAPKTTKKPSENCKMLNEANMKTVKQPVVTHTTKNSVGGSKTTDKHQFGNKTPFRFHNKGNEGSNPASKTQNMPKSNLSKFSSLLSAYSTHPNPNVSSPELKPASKKTTKLKALKQKDLEQNALKEESTNKSDALLHDHGAPKSTAAASTGSNEEPPEPENSNKNESTPIKPVNPSTICDKVNELSDVKSETTETTETTATTGETSYETCKGIVSTDAETTETTPDDNFNNEDTEGSGFKNSTKSWFDLVDEYNRTNEEQEAP